MGRKKKVNIQDLKKSQELAAMCFTLIAQAQFEGIKSEQVSKCLKFLDGIYAETTKAIELADASSGKELVENSSPGKELADASPAEAVNG